ncbi:crossover junction endonuclease EME1 [Galleria mellonella]|uniref:Crossover junction endonuclease EME1 n=1 Tax=Galleria mellonella TaxID=7137 RepID=A0ABM3N286_GALME|nr:crossover junction endonuclease EME1 [Galleria mellonella]
MTSKRHKRQSDDSNSIEIMDLTQEDDQEVPCEYIDLSAPSRSQTSTASSGTASEVSATTSGRKKMGRKSVGSLQEKSKKKSNAAEKQAKKQRIAESKAARAADREMNKIFKPGECMKHMSIEMHPVLAGAWYMADVAREAAGAGCRVASAADVCEPALVMWSRHRAHRTLAAAGRQVGLSGGKERCNRALFVCEAATAAELAAGRRLACHLGSVRDMASCPLTLVIFGLNDYFKSSGRNTINSNKKLITEIDLEMAITDLLVSADVDTIVVNTPNELALLIVQFTKAIAEEPYKKSKRACDEQAEFYMRGDKKKSVPVDKDGNGLSRLWQQMIAVLPLSSLETSRSLCALYKSPLELYKALQSPNCLNELADIGVSRAAIPGSRARRLGPEFARKLHTLFTAEDGNILID